MKCWYDGGMKRCSRTRKDRTMKAESEAGFGYPKKGKCTVWVAVLAPFGCDKRITVEVAF